MKKNHGIKPSTMIIMGTNSQSSLTYNKWNYKVDEKIEERTKVVIALMGRFFSGDQEVMS